jgi:hypothetical protein
MTSGDTLAFRNNGVSELGDTSATTRQRGGLVAVALALFCIQRRAHPARHHRRHRAGHRCFLSLAASLVVMAIRHILVLRGLMKPLSMKAEGTAPARPATRAGQDAARR